MRTFIFASIATLLSVNAASALCPAPGAPPKPTQSFDRPAPPACLANRGYSGNNCETQELDRYSVEVEAYINKLDDYVFAAERYAEDAAKFARCEADEARESLGD